MNALDLQCHIRRHPKIRLEVERAIGGLFQAINRAAIDSAECHASMHDDPSAMDYDDFHAPPEEQYPAATRMEALLLLLGKYEFTI